MHLSKQIKSALSIGALEGITCKPALVNDKPVAVRFRYPVRFVLS